jgi:hypothetical protein
LPACAFTPGTGGSGGTGGEQGSGSGTGSGVAPHLPCQLGDQSLALCLDFNGATSLGYDSSASQHDGDVTGVQAMVRDAVTPQDPAAAFSQNASITIPGSPSLDLPASQQMSIEVWIAPSITPPGMSTFPVLQHGQYEVAVRGDGRVRCTFGNAFADTAAIPTGTTWTHVGCTFDGSNVIAYINGDVSACLSPETWTALSPSPSVTVGLPFVGGIDNLHVLARTLSDTEVCTLAGKTECKNECP